MNGFKDGKSEKNYWIFSYIAVILFTIGFFFLTKEQLIIQPFEQKEYSSFALNLIFFISLFSVISALPIYMHTFFHKFMKNSFTFWYIKYMWRKERTNIMYILVELPPEIITTQEISFLSNQNQDLEEKQIQIIRKVWSRNLNYMVKYSKGTM